MSRTQLPGRCRDCPLHDRPIVKGRGLGGGPMILGEAPGSEEVRREEPFVGLSGRLLRETLTAVGVDPEEIYISNAVLCHPLGNATPDADMLAACATRLQREIAIVQPTKILCVGGVALTAAMRSARLLPITKWHGKGFWTEWPEKIYTVATYHPAAVLRTPDLFRDLARDIEKWATHDRPQPEPRIHQLVCERESHVSDALGELVKSADRSYKIISCDLETTGFNPLTDQIVSAGFGTELRHVKSTDCLSIIVPGRLLKSPRVQVSVARVLRGESFTGAIGFHNMKFDLEFLDVLFDEALRPPNVLDSMLMSYLLDERPIGSVFATHSLKAQARMRFDANDYAFDFDKHFQKTKQEQAAALPTMHHYQSLDLYYTAKLCREMRDELRGEENAKLREVYEQLLVPASYAFTEIELHGAQLDFPHLKRLERKFKRSAKEHLKRLQVIGAKYGFEEFNPGSSRQVAKLLYEKWNLPRVKVHGRNKNYVALSDKHGLDRLREQSKNEEHRGFIDDLLEYRAVIKELNTYVVAFMKQAEHDERIHTNFQLAGTVTGRLASWHPNLQNIPVQRGNALRNAFIASPGMDFIAADFAQLEVRVAAALSGDPSWVEAFRAGRDLHKMVASQMLKKPEADVTELERRMAKTVDFGILYGLGAKGLVEHEQIHKYRPKTVTLEQWHKIWNLEEAKKFLDLFKTQFPTLVEWMNQNKYFALHNHYIEAVTGRRRRFPFIPDANVAARIGREAANMPIQSAASDICLQALLQLHDKLPEGAYVLFSVHDAIYVECDKRLTKQVLKQVKDTMLSVVPEILGFVPEMPFDVKVEVGRCWAEESEDWRIAQATGKAVKVKAGR